jgi:hypothetical protein
MNSLLLFLLKSTLILSLLYLTFSVLMRKETFFQLNRMVLLVLVFSSLIIPILSIPQPIHTRIPVKLEPIFQTSPTIEEPVSTTETSVILQSEVPALETVQPVSIPIRTIVIFVYLFGVLVSFLMFVYSIGSVLLLFRKARKTVLSGIRIRIVDHDIPAFSFGRNILISQHDFDTNYEAIITHELSHIRLGHFYDLMLMELVKIIFWFNPLVYRMVNDLKEIHEFQADNHTLHSGIDATQYQFLIIQKCVGHQKFALANSFNHCQIKNRITMMNKQKTSKAGLWKVATFIPLLALLLMFCGKKDGNESPYFDRCEIVNKSMDKLSLFEIEVKRSSDNQLDNINNSNSRDLLWLSVRSNSSSELADGEYTYSSNIPKKRQSMTFTGFVQTSKGENKISGGKISIKKMGDKVNISYQLVVGNIEIYNLKDVNGSYLGSYRNIDQTKEANIQSIHDQEKLHGPNCASVLELSVAMMPDGNYIDNKRYSFHDLVKKKEALESSSHESLKFIAINIENVGIPEYRIREIHEMLGLKPDAFLSRSSDDQVEFRVVSEAMGMQTK